MKKLSTGDDSTLGNYFKLSFAVFGPNSKATQFINERIKISPNGENEEVIAEETQMVYVLGQLHLQGETK
jgi:hypothetical protein